MSNEEVTNNHEQAKVIAKLNEHMGIPGAARFEIGPAGFRQLILTTRFGEAHVLHYGAQVTHYQPVGREPVLYMSPSASFEPGAAIRGGVPVIFPWFGGHVPDDAADGASFHGIARTREWKFRSVKQLDDGRAVAELVLKWSPSTLAIWPHRFVAVLRVTLGESLDITLSVKHLGLPGSPPMRFEAALHTYFAVGNVADVAISGLSNKTYIDQLDPGEPKVQDTEPIRITSETDRIYRDATDLIRIDDPGMRRQILIRPRDARDAVLWNPWVAKAARLKDLPDDAWPQFVCVETANLLEHAVTLTSQQSHEMGVSISVTD